MTATSAPPEPAPRAVAEMTELTARDLEKLAGLRRAKIIATGLLGASFSVMVLAKAFEHSHPALGFVAAFAEAATVGGLADWYAVTALFKRPMGLPIPHTAIIETNRERIADSLGSFVEANFLRREPILAKLREVNFAVQISDWLSEPAKSASLAKFVLKLLPGALAGMDQSRMKEFVAERLKEQIERVKVAPLAASLLSAFTEDGRHQRLLDELVGAVEKILADQATLDGIRDKIRNELPSLFKLFQADAYLLRKIIASTASFLEEVKAEPDHPLRREFDRFVTAFIERLRESPDYAERVEQMKRDLLARKEIAELSQNVWRSIAAFVEQDLAAPQSRIEAQLADLFTDIGRKLAADPRMAAEINDGFVVALAAFVEQQKSGAARFIAEQVRSWDIRQLVRIIEINIGRDLQYIRLNGTLIGGLVGLVLHTGEVLLKAS